MKITFLVGLPGSGKTFLGEQLAEDPNVTYLDDITVKGGLDELDYAVNALGATDIVVSDVFLCRERDRTSALKHLKRIAPGYEVVWVFFENAPEKCVKNVRHRAKSGDERLVEGLIRELTREYVIPECVPVREIWQPK